MCMFNVNDYMMQEVLPFQNAVLWLPFYKVLLSFLSMTSKMVEKANNQISPNPK